MLVLVENVLFNVFVDDSRNRTFIKSREKNNGKSKSRRICTLSNVFKNIYDEIYVHDEKHNLCSCHDKIGSLFLFFLRKILKIREQRIDLLIHLPNLFKLL